MCCQEDCITGGVEGEVGKRVGKGSPVCFGDFAEIKLCEVECLRLGGVPKVIVIGK